MSVYVFKPDQHSSQSSLSDLQLPLAQDLTERLTFSFINQFGYHVWWCHFAKHGRQNRCSRNTYGMVSPAPLNNIAHSLLVM